MNGVEKKRFRQNEQSSKVAELVFCRAVPTRHRLKPNASNIIGRRKWSYEK
jgi:hypothetical protein